MSCKVIKVKLQGLCEGQFSLEEMTISKESEHIGLIKSVLPKDLNKDYKEENVFISSCDIGATPTLLCKLGIYNLELPCTVIDKIDWVQEDYEGIDRISLYPVSLSDEYERVEWKDMTITLDKEEFYPLYTRHKKLLSIGGYSRDTASDAVVFKIGLHDKDLKSIYIDRNELCLRLNIQTDIWKARFPDRTLSFILEYKSAVTCRNDWEN